MNMKHQYFSADWVSDCPVYHFECTTFDSLGEEESVNTFRICSAEMHKGYSELDCTAVERNLRQFRKAPKNTQVITTGTVVACCSEAGSLS